jgi:hypothetical protein
MKEEKLELRMYGLVPYQLTGIQQAIQFGHAVVEYGLTFGNTEKYLDWAKNWKTFIILNGGTTNTNPSTEDGLPFGTLNRHTMFLDDIDYQYEKFHEPDLGDQLTAIVFIVDERVFNKTKYPDPQPFATEEEFDLFLETIGGITNYNLRIFLKQFKLA